MLDAWALLALVFGEEPAASTVKEIFENEGASRPHVHMSWINLGEVYYMLGRKKGTNAADEVLKDIQMLPLTLHVPSKADILAAAKIKAKHRLSYADAFAVRPLSPLHLAVFPQEGADPRSPSENARATSFLVAQPFRAAEEPPDVQ
ncbi:MAG: type II toxin-antitoxin system VapC family toxin [Desulfacinum sp.]|nr:type II toxin-antitoxin system VapC family toxin [Desulfacinum sp.]